MRTLPTLLLTAIALLSAPLAAHASSGMKVWALGDGYRVNPISGAVFEQNELLFSDSPSGDLASSNVVWNGSYEDGLAACRAQRDRRVSTGHRKDGR